MRPQLGPRGLAIGASVLIVVGVIGLLVGLLLVRTPHRASDVYPAAAGPTIKSMLMPGVEEAASVWPGLDPDLKSALMLDAQLNGVRDLICGLALRDVTGHQGTKLSAGTSRFFPFHNRLRHEGKGWPLKAKSMAGCERLDNVRNLLVAAFANGIEGDFFETGTWRGGASIFARVVMDAMHESDRNVFVADSFAGLPKSTNPHDSNSWSEMEYLAVSLDDVKENFKQFGVLGDHTVFIKGMFADSLPEFRAAHGASTRLAVLRLDGDMYSSTSDALYNLYPLMQPEGYVIVDDWAIGNARKAVKDFWLHHNLRDGEKIYPIDNSAVYFQVRTPLKNSDLEHYRTLFDGSRTFDGKKQKLLLRPSIRKRSDTAWMAKCAVFPYPCIDEFEP